jgi:insertion element IS1 protein InsB
MAVVCAIRHGYSVFAPPRSLTHEKKGGDIHPVNHAALALLPPAQVIVDIQQADEAEMDERWSFVGRKGCQRWRWHAIDHHSGAMLAYVLGTHTDQVFLEWQRLLAPFGITRFYTDNWGTYQRHLTPEQHVLGKKYTQDDRKKTSDTENTDQPFSTKDDLLF